MSKSFALKEGWLAWGGRAASFCGMAAEALAGSLRGRPFEPGRRSDLAG